MKFYDRLQQETEAARDYLLRAPIIETVLSGDFSIYTYLAFLNQAFHHVKHTATLLELAESTLEDRHASVKTALRHYIEEEQGHEQWILEDIRQCGFDAELIEDGLAPNPIKAMTDRLFEAIGAGQGLAIFGMVQVLEGTSASLAPLVARLIREKLSLPDQALTYLTTHGELDQDHLKFFERIMNQIENVTDQQCIIDMANVVYRHYGDAYRDIPGQAAIFEQGLAA